MVDVEAAVRPERLGPGSRSTSPTPAPTCRSTQLAGGASNLTFRVRDGEHDWVLRRPPLSHVLATAHDMGREHRVQAALEPTDVPVAGQVVECTDDSVIGAPFYVMERLDGVVYDDADATAGLTEDQGLAASYELVDVLARLHARRPRRRRSRRLRPSGRLPHPAGRPLADPVGEVEDGRPAGGRGGRGAAGPLGAGRTPARDRARRLQLQQHHVPPRRPDAHAGDPRLGDVDAGRRAHRRRHARGLLG